MKVFNKSNIELDPHRVAATAERASYEAAQWVVALGRIGHAAHGGVYATIGFLAAQAALGAGGAATDSDGVLEWLIEAEFGHGLLIVMALALACYAIWRFVQASRDTEGRGSSTTGLVERGGYAGSGLTHLSLALAGLQLGLGMRVPGNHNAVRDWTALVLDFPWGHALIFVAGCILVLVAVWQGIRAYRADFRRHFESTAVSPALQCWIIRLGRLGYASRMVIFTIVGGFLIRAALERDPGEARGLGESLQVLASQPAGASLLGVVAIGLLAYGAFEIAEAMFRDMRITPQAD